MMSRDFPGTHKEALSTKREMETITHLHFQSVWTTHICTKVTMKSHARHVVQVSLKELLMIDTKAQHAASADESPAICKKLCYVCQTECYNNKLI